MTDKVILHYETAKADKTPEVSIMVPSPMVNLYIKCRDSLRGDSGGEVVLGTYRFNTDDKTDLDYEPYTISIVRGKLHREGIDTEIRTVMDNKCRKVIMSVREHPQIKEEKVAGDILQ